MSLSHHVLPIALEASVAIHAIDFIKANQVPDCTDKAHELANLIAHKGDVLLFGEKPGEAAKIFNELAFVVACLSFAPGGIHLFGIHFQNFLNPS